MIWKRIHRVMQEGDFVLRVRRSVTAGQNCHASGRWLNLRRRFTLDHPDQVWYAEIAYIRLRSQYCYQVILSELLAGGTGPAPGPQLDQRFGGSPAAANAVPAPARDPSFG
ncbi:MAG: hypothetical protein MUQ10_12890 [Anaerolineae bacterium]|nr:hypothetical protein [Anaerolineae bacterium]